ncbi:hypothetical protein FisN_3Hh418 [Fistulifera solaris]|uniref:Endoplasmic reticulum-Golgi intermediate compartment protein 3 n=1 Tax=Fistulifera solaris TaxID=1519565 RepID=A0A1Z5K823_FISSO|nr:hypothetical protein FisN_3Hh418 [Fistulifera solaris]|eukprot:GAX22374.1 hypothetical protein FisN_3Hh418 [Fistulifera solaris]
MSHAPNYATSQYGGYAGADTSGMDLRRRNLNTAEHSFSSPKKRMTFGEGDRSTKANVVKRLDFMFPKVDQEYTVKTDGGGYFSLIAYILIAILSLAETISWMNQNAQTLEQIAVDTSLGRKMRVNMNITFPNLACEDLHVDVMDVAGDSQLDIFDTLVKKRLSRSGRPIGNDVLKAEANANQQRQEEKLRLLKEKLPENYCGPCYGANDDENQCCNTCDELLEAYIAKKWRTDIVQYTSEQCMREGRDKKEPKRMKRGEGCNLSGYLEVNRVAGNFHIAMGEGIERDGKHIHTFNPEDTPNFNASHIIHDLSFGASGTKVGFGEEPQKTLNGVSKIVTRQHGTTGLFQYFIKVVPTSYITDSGVRIATNGYFFTERFRPLMKEYIAEDDYEDEDETDENGKRIVAVQAGHAHKAKTSNHDVRNAVLPGVFFIYEIYPFEVQIRKNKVPLTHLLIRLMATVGGVFTMFKLADNLLYSAGPSKRSSTWS